MDCKNDIKLFRVRKSWDNIASQKGAFFLLDNAVKTAKENGLNVYNSKKECVFMFENKI